MKEKYKSLLFKSILAICLIFCGVTITNHAAIATSSSFRISPMYQDMSLIPGETAYSTFNITNPDNNEGNLRYKLYVQAFKAVDDEDVVFENNGDYNQIVDWVKLENTEGVISPNETKEIEFSITVPEDAPAGGQYAAIMIRQEASGTIGDAVNLQQNYEISHLIYADVAGETVRKGEIDKKSLKIPSFLFSGDISGTATIKNIGNVHSLASYTLQVFPLFSNEELYTNEENPNVSFIMPGVTKTATTAWNDTPKIGIFRVKYTAGFEGVSETIEKYVIVCPIWLLLVILAIIFLVLFKILFTGKGEKKAKK